MKCPVDNETLVMSERHGIEIDYCPKCRGAWLDRGELDKIIERSATPEARPAAPSRGADYSDRYEREQQRQPQQPHKRKRESFLGDLFDF